MASNAGEPPDAVGFTASRFADSHEVRRRLLEFLSYEHPTGPDLLGVSAASGEIEVRRSAPAGVPLRRTPRALAPAVFAQAASAILFYASKGFPLTGEDFESCLVEPWNGSAHLWMPGLPSSACREMPGAPPVEAAIAAVAAAVFAGGGRTRRKAPERVAPLLARLLSPAARSARSDHWMAEIFTRLGLLEDEAAPARQRCVGFRPAGLDRRERHHRARLLAARIALAGGRPRILTAGGAPGAPGDPPAEPLAALSERDSHWLLLDVEDWEDGARRRAEEIARGAGVEIVPMSRRPPRLRPDELREAVWIPAPSLPASVELYEALAASVARNPSGMRRQVARFLGSPAYGEFFARGAVAGFLREAVPEEARRAVAGFSPLERRAAGLFAVHPHGVFERDVDALCGEGVFGRVARELAARGWAYAEPESGRWRVADASARCDLAGAFPPAEISRLSAAWAAAAADGASKLEFSLAAGATSEIDRLSSLLFSRPDEAPRDAGLDALAARVVARRGADAPAPVVLHEAERLASGGEDGAASGLLLPALGRSGSPAGRRRILALLGECSVRAGELDRALSCFGEILADPDSGPPERRRAERGMGRAVLRKEGVAAARPWVARVRERRDASPREAFEDALLLADAASAAGDFALEREIYERWRGPSADLGVEAQVRLLLREGKLLSDRRDHAGAALRFREARDAAGGHTELRGSALMDLAIALDLIGETGEAEASMREALAALESAGQRRLARRAAGNLLFFLLRHGRLPELPSLIEELLRDAEEADDRHARLAAFSTRARLHLRLGRFAEARADRAAALALCERLDDRIERSELWIEESDGRLFEGRREEAREAARRAAGEPRDRLGAAEAAASRLRDFQRWEAAGAEGALDGPEIEEQLSRDALAGSERVARARAYFGEALERAHPALAERAREILVAAGRGAFAGAVFGATKVLTPAGLRDLRDRMLSGAAPLRLTDSDGREVWRSGAFREASWAREVRRDGQVFRLEGDGEDAEAAPILFELAWPAPALSAADGRGRGIEILRESGIVASDASMEAMGERLARVAPEDVTVFVTGESGTGKELVARAIHRLSRRARGPFVAVNVAALPEHLLEGELFGHVRGAFTGADRDRAGLVEAASGGTLFLDEIADLPAPLQAKLLRVLQEREIKRVGENRSRPVDFRLVSASARPLEREVEAGRFREDLYYRVKVVTLALPALRQRGADVVLLARHFLDRFAREHSRGELRLTPRAIARVRRFSWPGNVRQLENVLREAVVMAPPGGEVDLEMLPAPAARDEAESAGSYRQQVDDFRRRVVAAALARRDGNRTHAARDLGLTRQALLYLIRELRIPG